MVGSRALLWVERVLVVVGVACLGWWTTATLHGWYFRSQQLSTFERLIGAGVRTSLPPIAAPAVEPLRAARDSTDLVGILDVPRLGISTPVISGDDDRALDVAAGHLADTPLPWEAGNTAVAAHRDGLFRPLKRVRRGDRIRMRTVHGDFSYVVRDTKIVAPDDLSVLASGTTDSLTLITCYPFAYVGHAPQRFIVRADRELPPAAASAAGPAAVASVSSPPRPARASKVRAAKAPKRDVGAAKRDGLKRESVSRPSQKASSASQKASRPSQEASASKKSANKDEAPKKKRRWYHRLFL